MGGGCGWRGLTHLDSVCCVGVALNDSLLPPTRVLCLLTRLDTHSPISTSFHPDDDAPNDARRCADRGADPRLTCSTRLPIDANVTRHQCETSAPYALVCPSCHPVDVLFCEYICMLASALSALSTASASLCSSYDFCPLHMPFAHLSVLFSLSIMGDLQ